MNTVNSLKGGCQKAPGAAIRKGAMLATTIDETLIDILHGLRATDRYMHVIVQEKLGVIETSLIVRMKIRWDFYARSKNEWPYNLCPIFCSTWRTSPTTDELYATTGSCYTAGMDTPNALHERQHGLGRAVTKSRFVDS